MPIVRRSSVSMPNSSPKAAFASRPTRYSAPVSGARIESPEQSAKIFARTIWRLYVVSWKPSTLAMRSPSIFTEWHAQLRISSRFGWKRAFS